MFVFMGVLQVLLGAFRGAGNTGTALAFSLVALWVVRVPVTYWLSFEAGWGPQGVWTGFAAGDIVACVAAGAWVLRGTWKSAVVDDEAAGSPEGATGTGTAAADGD
jgi:Na+-driven multidrug efflux pump